MSFDQKELQTKLDAVGLPVNNFSFSLGALSGCAVTPEYPRYGELLCYLFAFSKEKQDSFTRKSGELHAVVDFAQNCIEEIYATLERGDYGAFFKSQEALTNEESLREWCKGFITAVYTWVRERDAQELIPVETRKAVGLMVYFSEKTKYRRIPEIRKLKEAGKLDNPFQLVPELVQDIHKGLSPLIELFDMAGHNEFREHPDDPKTGRNDPCPCGSGKKHKKCCGKI